MKKKDLKAIAKELNEVCLEEEDHVDPNKDPKKLEAELREAVSGDDPEIEIYEEDEFSEKGWELLAELGCETAKQKLSGGDEEEEEEEETETEDEEEEDEEEAGEDEEGYAREDIEQMTKKKELKEVIEEADLDLDASKYKKVPELREAVIEALFGGEEEEEEEEEESEVDKDSLIEEINAADKLKDLKNLAKENEVVFDDLEIGDYKGAKGLKQLREDMLSVLGVEDEEDEEEEEEEQEEEEKPAKKSKGKKKEEPKKTEKKEKPAQKKQEKNETKEKDEFGYTVGTKSHKFIESVRKQPMTMAEVRELPWNENKAAYNTTFGQMKKMGIMDRDENGIMYFVDQGAPSKKKDKKKSKSASKKKK